MAQHETFHRENRLLAIYAIAFAVFLYLPILFIPVFSFNPGICVKFPLEAFTFDWYADLMGRTTLHHALYNSLKVGAFVSVLSTILAVPAAMAIARYRLPGKAPVVGFTMLPLVVPGLTFWRLTFPGVLSCLLMTFTISFDEFFMAFFPSGTEATLPMYIWTQLRFPTNFRSLLALATIILVVSFVLVFSALKLGQVIQVDSPAALYERPRSHAIAIRPESFALHPMAPVNGHAIQAELHAKHYLGGRQILCSRRRQPDAHRGCQPKHAGRHAARSVRG